MPDGGGAQGVVIDEKRSWLERFLGMPLPANGAADDKTWLREVTSMLDGVQQEIAASRNKPNYKTLNIVKAELASPDSPVLKRLQGKSSSPEAAAQAKRAMDLLGAANDLLFKGDMTEARQLTATLQKRVAETATQPVGEKVRLLSTYQAELKKPPIASITGDKGTASQDLSKSIAALDTQITSLIAAAKADALKAITAHASQWQKALSSANTPKAKLALITDVEKGMAEDKGLAQRLGIDVGPLMAHLLQQVAAVRTSYVSDIPTRKSTAEPTTAPEVKKPLLGDAAVPTELEKLLSGTEGKMSKGEKPNPDDVAKQVELIKGIGFCGTAEENMKKLGSWEAAKKAYKEQSARDPEAAKKFMSELWWYRRQLVDGTMLKLQKQYDFAWGSVGSANLESDYDVTVRTHGKSIFIPGGDGEEPVGRPCKYDYEIVAEFNEILSGMFKGTAPGIVFDTNLYAEAVPEEEPAWGTSPIAKDMKAMRESGQDVGALMKLRRFMDEEEYQTYMEGVLEPLKGDREAYKTMKNQFEEADANYQLARMAQLEATKDSHVPNQLPAQDGPAKGAIEQQLENLHAGEELDEDGPKAMATNNKLYLQALAEARKIEEALVTAATAADKDALFTQLKGMQARATFFAAEAYHSEGPLKHVVQAAQSSAVAINTGDATKDLPKDQRDILIADATKKKLEMLSPMQLLQSFNENNGDLLKDIKHYEHESPFPGLGFYRCSKYLERICDAAEWIATNLPDKAQKDALAKLTIGGKKPNEVKAGVKGLVAIRGGKKEFTAGGDVTDPEAEKEAYAVAEMAKIFPTVKTLRDLAGVANEYSAKVNTLVRSWEAQKMKASDTSAFFKPPAAT